MRFDSQADFPLELLPYLLRAAASQIEELAARPEPFIAPIRLAEIRDAVCDSFEITERRLLASRRSCPHPRWAAWRLARDMTNCSFPVIGRFFNRHHTTVMHGIRQAEILIGESADFKEKYELCEDILDAERYGNSAGRVTNADGGNRQSFAADNVTTVHFPSSRPGRDL